MKKEDKKLSHDTCWITTQKKVQKTIVALFFSHFSFVKSRELKDIIQSMLKKKKIN